MAFSVGAQQTQRDITACFKQWGIANYELSLARNSQNGEASVKFMHSKLGQRALVCDSFPEYYQNLRAIYLTLDGIRLAEGRGILEQYRQFFEALPAPGQTSAITTLWGILGVQENAPLEIAEAAYRVRSKKAHPDAGGSNEEMIQLNQAIEHFRERTK